MVIDQSFGDMSVTGGLADAKTFTQMMEAALDENPLADVFVRMHPDVAAGHCPGFLDRLPQDPRLYLLHANDCPWSVLDGVETVYCVTSLMGFEGAIAGKRVRCFGMPFYAGWGITEDEMKCSRRTSRRTIDEVVTAAYILYARYVNHAQGVSCQVEDICELLIEERNDCRLSVGYKAKK